MQQYYQSVCERQQQALRRNQALQQDVRRAHTFAASGVDTSQLELLKVRHCLFLYVDTCNCNSHDSTCVGGWGGEGGMDSSIYEVPHMHVR